MTKRPVKLYFFIRYTFWNDIPKYLAFQAISWGKQYIPVARGSNSTSLLIVALIKGRNRSVVNQRINYPTYRFFFRLFLPTTEAGRNPLLKCEIPTERSPLFKIPGFWGDAQRNGLSDGETARGCISRLSADSEKGCITGAPTRPIRPSGLVTPCSRISGWEWVLSKISRLLLLQQKTRTAVRMMRHVILARQEQPHQ